MANQNRFKIAWITLVALLLFLLNPGYPVQTQDEQRGLRLIRQAEAQYNRFQITEAINTYKEALKYVYNEKNLVRIHLGLAKAYFFTGDNQNTEKSLEEMFKIKGDVTIRESEYVDAFLEIFNRISQIYVNKQVVKPKDQKVEKLGVIEKPLAQKKPKKKKSPLIYILGGVAVAAAVAVLAFGGKSSDNGPSVSTVSIHVDSVPASANIYVDGSFKGMGTPAEITVTEGSHEIRLAKEGFGEARKTFTFSAGQTYNLHAYLSPYVYEFVSEWGTRGSGDGQFSSPRGIAVGSRGIYVADQFNHRIQKFDYSGSFVWKRGQEGSGDGEFEQPLSIASDNSDNVYIFDWGSNGIQKFSTNGAYLSWGVTGQFGTVYGIAVDNSGNIYITDSSNNRFQKFSANGNFLAKWGSYGTGDGQFDSPSGVAIDSSANIYVVDYRNDRVQKFSSSGAFLAKFGSRGSMDGQFKGPTGITIDSWDNIFVLDMLNNRIQKFCLDDSWLSHDGQGFVYTWGSKGSGNGQFESPRGIDVDGDGNVYVTDSTLHRVQKFELMGHMVDDGSWNQSIKKVPISRTRFLHSKNDPQKRKDLRKKRQEEIKSNKIKK